MDDIKIFIKEKNITIPLPKNNWISDILNSIKLEDNETLLRYVITENKKKLKIEYLIETGIKFPNDIEKFKIRPFENTNTFNPVILIPTGVGCNIGGHAGDAGVIVKAIGNISDSIILHPNVVNASDINEMPSNAVYVEGSILSRLLNGTIGLQKIRNNRILVLMDEHDNSLFTNAVINSVNGARATYGIDVVDILTMKSPSMNMKADYSLSGRATGEILNFESLLKTLSSYTKHYDAIAISSKVVLPEAEHLKYFSGTDDILVNPWGNLEAMLTHTVSGLYNIPTAHAPMSNTIEELLYSDKVDPRMAAEMVSIAFIQCILKGLQYSPKIISNIELGKTSLLDATNISALVQPDNVIGEPTLAALYQGIPVIAVKENKNIMKNSLTVLPWAENQLYIVDNYWEAIGVLVAIKSGVSPKTMRRPLLSVDVN